MPRVEIQRAGSSNIPSRTYQPNATEINPDTSVGRALQERGDVALSIGINTLREDKMARDSTYVANQSVQINARLQELSEKLKKDGSDPEGYSQRFSEASKSLYEEVINNAPSSESRRVLESQMAGVAKSAFNQAYNYEKGAIKAKYASQHDTSLNLLGNELLRDPGNFESITAQHDQLLSTLNTYLDPVEVREINDRDKEYLAKSYVKGLIANDPNSAIETLTSGAFDATFSAEQTDGLLRSAKQQIAHNEAESKKYATKAHQQLLDQIDLGIFNNEVRPDDLYDLHDKGSITTKEFISRATKLNKVLEKDAKEFGDITLVQGALENGIPLDPTDKNVKKSVDTYYNQVFLDSVQDLQPEQGKALTLEFVKSVGRVPESLHKSLTGNLLNGKASQKVEAAAMINAIVANNPPLTKQFKTTEMSYARKVFNSVQAGLSTDEAIQAADSSLLVIEEKGSTAYNQKVKTFNKERSAFDNDRFEDGFFTSLPEEVPAAMKAEWEETYQTLAVDLKNDLPDAEDIAYKKLSASWGVSEINGSKEYMKYAPEKEYGVPGYDSTWMKKQLDSNVKQLKGEGYDTSKVFVTPDPRSYLSEKKSYMVGEIDDDGSVHIFKHKDGFPLTWRPDIQEESENLREIINKSKLQEQKLLEQKIIIRQDQSSPEYQEEQIMKNRLLF